MGAPGGAPEGENVDISLHVERKGVLGSCASGSILPNIFGDFGAGFRYFLHKCAILEHLGSRGPRPVRRRHDFHKEILMFFASAAGALGLVCFGEYFT